MGRSCKVISYPENKEIKGVYMWAMIDNGLVSGTYFAYLWGMG
jgi:hypothetical protein